MGDRKSTTVGYLKGWEGYLVYEAVEDQFCHRCGLRIPKGFHFARTKIEGNRSGPTCKMCL